MSESNNHVFDEEFPSTLENYIIIKSDKKT